MASRNIKSTCTTSLFVLVASGLLAGCSTTEGEFPSLAKRPYESDDPIAEPVGREPVVASSLPASLAAQVAGLEARHAKAQAAYEQALPGVRATATRSAGAAAGSEAWASANVVLSRLDFARADSVKAAGEMDALVSAQRDADADSGQPEVTPLLEQRQKAMADAVERQSAEINRLAAMLGG